MNDRDITIAISDYPRPFKEGDVVIFIGEDPLLDHYSGMLFDVISTTGGTTFVRSAVGSTHTFRSENLQLVDQDDPKLNVVAEPPIPPRQVVLEVAIEAVTKQRNNQYGPPTQDFDRVASLATNLGFSVNGEDLGPHHVAMFMMLIKLSRATWDPTDLDHWVDMAGYAACGYECVVEENDES